MSDDRDTLGNPFDPNVEWTALRLDNLESNANAFCALAAAQARCPHEYDAETLVALVSFIPSLIARVRATQEAVPRAEQAARHLSLISVDLRLAGDVPLVQLGLEGVTDSSATLADELFYIACGLDFTAAMDVAKDREERGGR